MEEIIKREDYGDWLDPNAPYVNRSVGRRLRCLPKDTRRPHVHRPRGFVDTYCKVTSTNEDQES